MEQLIALITDFGLSDPYVGIMKGVIRKIFPQIKPIIDLTHLIPPQNVLNATFHLMNSFTYFPLGTIFCCIVDPEVGSKRRAIAIKTENYFFVGPDNGIFTGILNLEQIELVIELNNPNFHLPIISPTFHGRDIFAPVCAYIASGIPFTSIGEEITVSSLKKLQNLNSKQLINGFKVSVLHIDHFGNLVSNLKKRDLTKPLNQYEISINGVKIIGIKDTFSDVELGKPICYFGSSGNLEIAIRNGNASQTLKSNIGTKVIVTFNPKL